MENIYKNRALIQWILFILYFLVIIVSEVFYRNTLFENSLRWIEENQKRNNYNNWVKFFEIISLFGTQGTFMIMFLILFLFNNTKKAYLFLFAFSFSMYLVNVMKNVYSSPRPFFINRNIEVKHCDAGYGNPSGHSLSSSCCYLSFVYLITDIEYFKEKKYLRVILLTITFIFFLTIIYSRFFLGVHSLNQLIFGLLLGLGLFAFIFLVFRLQEITDQYFVDLFVSKSKFFFHMIFFLGLILINFGLYYFNNNDNSAYKEVIEKECPDKPLYRRFNNDAGINSLTIFSFFGAYLGLYLCLKIKFDYTICSFITTWNKTTLRKKIVIIAITIVSSGLTMSPYFLVSSKASLVIIILFKIISPFLLTGLVLYCGVLYLVFRFDLANKKTLSIGYFGELSNENQL